MIKRWLYVCIILKCCKFSLKIERETNWMNFKQVENKCWEPSWVPNNRNSFYSTLRRTSRIPSSPVVVQRPVVPAPGRRLFFSLDQSRLSWERCQQAKLDPIIIISWTQVLTVFSTRFSQWSPHKNSRSGWVAWDNVWLRPEWTAMSSWLAM